MTANEEWTGTSHPAGTVAGDGSAPAAEEQDSLAVRRRLVRALLRADHGLHYLAHCRVGTRDFDDDLLADLSSGDRGPVGSRDGGPVADERRESCRSIAEKVSFQCARHLNDCLSDLNTGPLIRVVLQSRTGALYCNQIVPDNYLVGATLGLPLDAPQPVRQAMVDRADEAISNLVEEIRHRIHLRELDLGGFSTARLRQELAETEARHASEAEEASGESTGARPQVGGDGDHPAVPLCRDTVGPGTLHLVQLFVDNRPVFTVDVLNDVRVRPRGGEHVGASVRREHYQRVGLVLPSYVRELGRTARRAIGGPLIRAVLDVEQGAIYYHRLADGEYLVGLTLFQQQVKPAEEGFARIIAAWTH